MYAVRRTRSGRKQKAARSASGVIFTAAPTPAHAAARDGSAATAATAAAPMNGLTWPRAIASLTGSVTARTAAPRHSVARDAPGATSRDHHRQKAVPATAMSSTQSTHATGWSSSAQGTKASSATGG